MNWFCKIKHKWIRLKEPNNFGFSIRICKRCKTIQRYSVHSGNWFTINDYKEQYLEAFNKSKKEGNKNEKR